MDDSSLDTRSRILAEAYREFLENGYKRADLTAIVRRAGVTKGALYYYFKSKIDLADGVIDLEIAGRFDRFVNDTGLQSDDITLQEWLLAIVSAMSPEEILNGPVLIKLASEIPSELASTHSRIRAIADRAKSLTGDKIRREQSRRRISKEFEPDDLAQFICSLVFGGMTLSQIHKSRLPLDTAVTQFNALLDCAGCRESA